MKLQIAPELMARIERHGAAAYPGEGAGFLLGRHEGDQRQVLAVLPVGNEREGAARHNRYLIGPRQMLQAEQAAESRQLELLGVFHSHPDHPNRPSETDRRWALPWLSYLITTVEGGRARESRAWRLADDRSQFLEEIVEIVEIYKEKP